LTADRAPLVARCAAFIAGRATLTDERKRSTADRAPFVVLCAPVIADHATLADERKPWTAECARSIDARKTFAG